MTPQSLSARFEAQYAKDRRVAGLINWEGLVWACSVGWRWPGSREGKSALSLGVLERRLHFV
jgi:hypothetical protein